MYETVRLDSIKGGDIIQSMERSTMRCCVIDFMPTLLPKVVDVRVVMMEGKQKGKIKIFYRKAPGELVNRWELRNAIC